jgi:hypothetical protein
MDKNEKKLRELLSKYSINDLLRSYFVLNLWLPNVASPIKSQYLYVLLEAIHGKLPEDDRIGTYKEFEFFSKELIELLPPPSDA